MTDLHLTPPNTCALILVGSTIYYVETSPETNIGAPEGYTSFEQFLTPDDALVRAKEIDPAYNANAILGPLLLDPENVSPAAVSVNEGDTVTLNGDYSCEGATITYQWYIGPTPLEGATSSSLTLQNVTSKNATNYTCSAQAVNAKGQTGGAGNSVFVNVVPASVSLAE